MLAHFGQNTWQDSHNTQNVTENSNVHSRKPQNIAEDRLAYSQPSNMVGDNNFLSHKNQNIAEN